MISSLVIPQTPVPDILQIHRRNITLSWEAVYYPTSQDQTRYGVNITICRADVVLPSQAQGLLQATTSSDDNQVTHCTVITKDKHDLIQMKSLQLSATKEEDLLPIVFTHVSNHLQPSVNYKIRCADLSQFFYLLIFA
jgi:hypothetical protein